MPVASGATVSTAAAKRCIVALSFWSPFGLTSTRALPSSAIQSCLRSCGSPASETRSGLKARADLLKPQLQSARAACSRCRRDARRRSQRALSATVAMSAVRGHLFAVAGRFSEGLAPHRSSACRVSSSLGGAAISATSSVGSSRDAASPMMASFSSWSLGTKLCSVTVSETSGSLSRRCVERLGFARATD